MKSSVEEILSCDPESFQQEVMNTADADGHTQLAAPLSDDDGNEISGSDLQKMLGSGSEASIGVLENMTPIGMGGIGAVFSAQDPTLRREIAIKILRPAYRNQLKYVSSFIREARITAQIDHPNVIPVHKLGVFDDAGAYFTMKRVKGITLAQILRKLREGDANTLKTYTRQRLLEIFVSICNGTAFAHSKGIIHRDLKPANIMVGEYGEVFIADWGLAIYRAENDTSHAAGKISLGHLPEEKKVAGEPVRVSGTPAFMAPEQILSQDDELDSQIDVYALGTILYSILTWEPSPFEGASTVTELMHDVASHKFLRPRRRAPRRRIPYELEAITLKAMHADKKERYESVIALLADVRNYLAKYPVSAYSPLPHYRLYKLIRRHPLIPVTLLAALLTLGVWNLSVKFRNHIESQSLMLLANDLLEECEKSRNQAISSRNKLNETFARTGNTEVHGSGLHLKSRYLRNSNEFAVSSNNSWDLLTKMLNLDVDHKVLTKYIARLLNNQIQFAQAVNNQALLKHAFGRFNSLPEDIKEMLFESSPALFRQIKTFENSSGELKINIPQKGINIIAIKEDSAAAPIQTEAENAFIKIVPAPAVNSLKAGQYTFIASLPNGRGLRFPVSIGRNKLEVINFDPPGAIPDNMVYIPEGNFIFGERTFDDQFARTRLPAFLIGKYEVTIGEYLKFWQSLTDPALKEQYRSRIDADIANGRKLLDLWDDQGNLLAPYKADMPVVGITPEAVNAYMKYMSRKTNMHYRLPTALEWEKAARGVDGRVYVWGNDYTPGLACISEPGQTVQKKHPATSGSYPQDRSVYGVFDMTGNVRELVHNPTSWQRYTAKGSSFRYSQRLARVANNAYASNLSDLGFRCAVELPVKSK